MPVKALLSVYCHRLRKTNWIGYDIIIMSSTAKNRDGENTYGKYISAKAA